MISGLIGKKVGMTQVIQTDGTVVPVTVIQAGPCVVVQKKTVEKDGYEAVQLGFVEFIKPKRMEWVEYTRHVSDWEIQRYTEFF